jgi:hypothetical protein
MQSAKNADYELPSEKRMFLTLLTIGTFRCTKEHYPKNTTDVLQSVLNPEISVRLLSLY